MQYFDLFLDLVVVVLTRSELRSVRFTCLLSQLVINLIRDFYIIIYLLYARCG